MISNHPSFFRLQRPALVVKSAFWSFLLGLFVLQQVLGLTAPAGPMHGTLLFAAEMISKSSPVVAGVLLLGALGILVGRRYLVTSQKQK